MNTSILLGGVTVVRLVQWLVAGGILAAGVASAANAQIAVKPADPLAQYVKASEWVETDKGKYYLELLTDEEFAGIRVRPETGEAPKIIRLSTPGQTVRILTDRRMKAFWQPLKAWAGPSLDAMRLRIERQRRAAFERQEPEFAAESTGQSIVRPSVKALLQLASILIETGKSQEAEALLQQNLSTSKFSLKPGRRGIEWQLIASEIARARRSRSDFAGALAQYEYVERTMAGSPYALNASVNRAANLAELGRYQEALTLIDKAWSEFSQEAVKSGEDVPGSDRQFGWIRACALNGLGRKAEAAAIMDKIEPDGIWSDPDFKIEPNNSVRFRGALCMKDVPALKRLLQADLNSGAVAPALLYFLQPGLVGEVTNRDLFALLRADPELQSAVKERMEVLPPELFPALNNWHANAQQQAQAPAKSST